MAVDRNSIADRRTVAGLLKAVEQVLATCLESKYTGQLRFEVNISNGGVASAFLEKKSRVI